MAPHEIHSILLRPPPPFDCSLSYSEDTQVYVSAANIGKSHFNGGCTLHLVANSSAIIRLFSRSMDNSSHELNALVAFSSLAIVAHTCSFSRFGVEA